jgi:lysophospholipase L1-like esterase
MNITPDHPLKKLFVALLFIAAATACKKNKHAKFPETFIIQGETIALSGESPSLLLKSSVGIQKVYKLEENGSETVFKEGIDYLVVQNGLKRTSSSTIPDFSTHKMILNANGKFTWQPEPNRNPQLSLLWQVMVNYTTTKDSSIQSQSSHLNNELKTKIIARSDLKLTCIGTSITAAAHTVTGYYQNSDTAGYPYLVAKGMKKLYGNNVSVTNLSVGGATTALFTSKIPQIISSKPDVVFVEFGMNEHLIGSDMDGNLSAMEAGIKQLLSNNIACILVGFFQQNPYWELESIESTRYYNEKLREMAARNEIYLADIYQLFDRLPKDKMYRDLMGDYHHHPTDFSHKLYYISIMPAFILQNKMESELLGAIQP